MSSRGAAEEQPHICHCEESLTLVKGEWTTKQSRASEASPQPYHGIATLGSFTPSLAMTIDTPLSLRGRSPKQSRANRVSSLKKV